MNHWILLTALCVSGCDSGIEWKDSSNEVVWIDNGENRSHYFNLEGGGAISRVDPKVIAVGSNKQFVVVKQLNYENGLNYYYYIAKPEDHPTYNGNKLAKGHLILKSMKNYLKGLEC
jgi:hypothetical protein